MPTYQYACTACEHELEAVQKFTDDALTDCPQCEGRLRKIFSAVGVVFKGSGFYRTDSRAGAGKDGAGSKAPAKSGDSGSDTSSGSSGGGDSTSSSTAAASSASSSSSSSSSTAGSGSAGKSRGSESAA